MTITADPATADTLTPEDVHDVAFTPVRFRREGYDQSEVDNFLDRVENQLRSNDEYANGLLKLLQDNGIIAPSRDETPGQHSRIAPEILDGPTAKVLVTAVPTPIVDPANISLPKVA
jgi:DivIVA domain-containing protein